MLKESNWQYAIQLALFVPSLVILTTWVVPIAPIMPRPSLDPSWRLGMNYAVEHGWALGRDIIFTFGPLTSLFTHAYSPGTYPLVVGFSLVLAASFAIGLIRLFIAAPLLAIPLAVAMLIGVPQRDSLFLSYPLLFYCVVRAVGGGSNTLRNATLVGLLTPALGILSVVKGTFAVCAAAFVILSALYLLSIRRALLAAVICVVTAGSFLLAWISTGQSASDVGAYLQQMATMVGGYSEAMAKPGPWLEVVMQGAGSLVVLGTIIYANRKYWWTVPVLLDLSAFGLFLFLCFKAGMVRHDGGHAIISAVGLFLVAVLQLGHLKELAHRHAALALSVTAVTLLIGCVIQSHYISLKRAVLYHASGGAMHAYVTMAKDLVTGKSKSEAYADALRRIATDYPVLPVPGTVDIYSFDQAQVIAAGMQWAPRPVFQSYAAYVPSLIEKNVSHLSGHSAPQNIIFAVQPIDGRYPSLDDGASWPTIKRRYHFSAYHRGFAYFKQRENFPADPPPELVGPEQHQLGTEFEVPSTSGAVLTRIDIELTLLGKLLRLVFKPSQLRMTVTLSNGEVRTYRTISSMMQNAFVLSPLIDSTEDFVLYATGNVDRLAGTRVARMKIESAMSWLPLWQTRFTIRYSIQKPAKAPPSSLFAAQFTGVPDNLPAKRCNGTVDLINNRPPATARLSEPGPVLRPSGWLATVDNSSTIPSRVLISLDFADGTSEVYETQRTRRRDVAIALKKPSLVDVGYKALIDLQGKPAVEALGVIVDTGDALTKCRNLAVKWAPRP